MEVLEQNGEIAQLLQSRNNRQTGIENKAEQQNGHDAKLEKKEVQADYTEQYDT